DHAGAFAHRDQPIGGNPLEHFVEAVGPMDLDLRNGDAAETEMQARIIAGIKARLAEHCLRLRSVAVTNAYLRTNPAAVRPHAFQLHIDPVPRAFEIVA